METESKVFGVCSKVEQILQNSSENIEEIFEKPWTRDRLISIIQMCNMESIPLNFTFVKKNYPKFHKLAEKFFGSWKEAINYSGLDYGEIKRNKGSAKSFLAEDGILYGSEIYSVVANELYNMKINGNIVEYSPQQPIMLNGDLLCDFLVTMVNGTKLWLEINDDKNKLKNKIEYYNKANFLFYKINYNTNLKEVISNFTNWFTIPIKNCIVTSHKNPDGDALSSITAVYNYIINNNKKCSVKICGDIPKNLSWIISDVEVVKKIPEWTEMIIVLDCAPDITRIGWELPKIPIYNIDHHYSRIEENNHNNNIHIIKGCSTASILHNYFGLKDKILAVGVYTDTFFTKNIHEVFNFLDQINISENELNTYISKINSISDRKIWDILQNAKIHRCRNGFAIVEIDEYPPDVVECFMQILMKLNESVCLIFGKNKNVKLRTSNLKINLSDLAEEYGGGGHTYASVCCINGKINEFKSKITSLVVPKILDGYQNV